MIRSFTAGRRLQIGENWREPGEPVPEAYDWFRLDDWLHAGYIKEVQVSEKDFRASIERYAPGLADAIIEKAGLEDEVTLEGPRSYPQRTGKRVDKAPVALKSEPEPEPVAEPEPEPELEE